MQRTFELPDFDHNPEAKTNAIACTMPLIPDVHTPQQLLAYFARVSATANQLNHKTGPKLIRSLIDRAEWSPLQMVHVSVEVNTTRDVGRQILRHTTLAPQEFSQRYALVADKPIFRELRVAHPTDRQASLEVDLQDQTMWKWANEWLADQQNVWDIAMGVYIKHTEKGMSKEVARVVLPEGITPTHMYFTGPLRTWYHYCKLRIDRKTQKEHRQIAHGCWQIIKALFPDISGEDLEQYFEAAMQPSIT